MAGQCVPSPTDAEFMGTMFMATYLSSTPQVGLSVWGPPASLLVAARGNVAPPVSLAGGPHVGLSVGGPPVPLSEVAWGSVALPVSSLGGVGVQVGSSSGGPVDPGIFSPPCWFSEFSFPVGLSPPSAPPVRTPYLNPYHSLYSDPGRFPVYRPPPTMAFVGSGALTVGDGLPLHLSPGAPCPAHWPDPNEDVVYSPPSSHSLLPSLVFLGGQSRDRYGGLIWGAFWRMAIMVGIRLYLLQAAPGGLAHLPLWLGILRGPPILPAGVWFWVPHRRTIFLLLHWFVWHLPTMLPCHSLF
jgi:hypothetical protein